ncbi:MAG TPA: hypothetical protein VFQ35_14125 [Polyangiaceae bacterium]|nr:hypothetical protein [Polyangiaceae bacterium]
MSSFAGNSSLSLFFALAVLALAGCSTSAEESSCTPDDQDGVIGGKNVVLLSVSDVDFAVGAVGSGSTQRNITVQNSSELTLTLTNVGTKPHSFVVDCISTELPAECAQTSCFPPEANIPAVMPGESTTTKFVIPVVEGAYPFKSDVAGDDVLLGQFVVN